jgi:Na+/H+ antiporter NhaD/arsenite permease-like protein
MWVTIFMSLFSGLISAFIDNVATVLMVAPVGLAICKKLKISPVPMVLAIAVSSNLQGAATLVGDTTSIMLGAYAKMDFTDFFWMNGGPGIFFAVELGALMTVPVMLFLFRKDKQSVQADQKTKDTDYPPTFLLIAMVAALIIASFNKDKPEITNGLICCIAALIAVLLGLMKSSGTTHAIGALKSIDFETLLLLTGLFVVIEGITEVGLIDDIATVLGGVGGNNIFLLYTIIVWGSVLASAFIDTVIIP